MHRRNLAIQIAVQEDRRRDAILMVERLVPTMRRLHSEAMALWLSLKVEIAEGRAAGIKWQEIQGYFRRTWHKPAPFQAAPQPPENPPGT